ncbi:zinc finger protein ZFP2 isoform X1 [Bombyx mori]
MDTLLCRICLEPGASLFIFESCTENINSKIFVCLNEKIKDIAGYPRNICAKCNNILDTFISFIDKYRKSNQFLSKQFADVKVENTSEYDEPVESDTDIVIKEEIVNGKEGKEDNAQSLTELIKPLQLDIEKVKVEPLKKRLPSNSKSRNRTQTNKIASSILEGNFIWADNKWCVTVGETIIRKTKKVVKQAKIKPIVKVKKNLDPAKLCDLCGEVCKNTDKLATHKKLKHFSIPKQCPKCSKILSSEYYLNRHIKRRHDAESKNFKCTICSLSFAFKGELGSHIKHVHNKKNLPKKVFSCKICGKVYKCPKSVIVHERSIHTGQRPAECSICGARFYHDDYLKEHMRLHTGETPYKCPICSRGYAQRGNMKSHLRNHRRSDLDPVALSKIRPNYLKFMKP